jgi:RNA polymerase sigma-70 factor (ECF subfamily)
MMRITETSRSESVVRFRLEGRLNEESAGELRSSIELDLAAGRSVLLDLAELLNADAAGVAYLLDLRRRGVVLARCSAFLAELLRSEAASAQGSDDESVAPEGAEAALVARLRAGDEAAFAEMVSTNGPRLFATAQRMLRSEDDARDAVQEAFLCAFKALATFNATAKLSTWLHRITVNAALMRLRSRRTRSERSIDDLLPRFAEDGHFAEETGGWAVSSQDLVESRETRAMVRRCIALLPERYRTVLLMRDIEDLDTDEVAEMLGVTANAVKIRLHRARQALRTLIADQLSEAAPIAANAQWTVEGGVSPARCA